MKTTPTIEWSVQDKIYDMGKTPWIMGIVNVTPDSFSDGGEFLDADKAVAHALQLVDEGADILDIGGESTRPDSVPVSLEEELNRVVPVIEKLAKKTDTLISIDTTKSDVAKAALLAGASIVNDISGLTFDKRMPKICKEFEAGVICMHIQGTPQTMQENPTYDDCVTDIGQWLNSRLEALKAAGIPANRLAIDPGIGFGKTAKHNLEILSSIQKLRECGHPILIGHSRKRFLKSILNNPENEKLFGTIGVSVACAIQGADIIRVHDVAASKSAILAAQAVLDHQS